MKKLEDLIPLEKKSVVDFRFCEIVSDYDDVKKNIRFQIMKRDDRYFFQKMKDGDVVECYELALSFTAFGGKILIFAYTPDDKHVYQIDSRFPQIREVLQLKSNQIHEGDSCSYDGHTLVYVDRDTVMMDGIKIQVTDDSEYVYKIQARRKLRAKDGARGLYIFMEHIAEEAKFTRPLFSVAWGKICEKIRCN